MKVLCVIPVRGGSKYIPKKNLTKIGGKTLIAHAAECIANSETINRTIVSTDSEEIARYAKELNLEVPFLRPMQLAQDDTMDWPVFYHCLQWLKDNDNYIPDIVVHLRVTSPFAFKRTDSIQSNFFDSWVYIKRERVIDQVVQILITKPELDSIRTVELVRDTPYKMWRIEKDKLTPFIKTEIKEIYNQPRQKIPPVYLQNGYVDAARYKTILEKKSMTADNIGAYILDCDYLVDIDQYCDIDLGEILYRQIIKKEKIGEYQR